MNILCIHGVGHGDIDQNLQPSWEAAITSGLQKWDPNAAPTFTFLPYDDLFAQVPNNPATYAIAFARLLKSGVLHGIGDLFTRERGLFEVPALLRWTAGMVAQWASDDKLRSDARKFVSEAVEAGSFDLICAHSLGSLIAYDAFKRDPSLVQGKYFISFGSQIGNPFVRDLFAGRIDPLEATEWFHLFNPDDHALTAEVRLTAPNFLEVGTLFDVPNDLLNHDPVHYLSHPNTSESVWAKIAEATPQTLVRGLKAFAKANTKPERRALLVGINKYPDSANWLEGCINDCYLMSAMLQESGFRPEDIRLVTDDRATRAAIWDRMQWLLDGVQPGDQRVLFYSGHGAQIPTYGPSDEVDHLDECLVPYDFDWSPDHAITDKQFCELYSQLPYDSFFVGIFDCCHAGGLTRDGSMRIRGLNPPDDIRHRALRWNVKLKTWEDRLEKSAEAGPTTKADAAYVGSNGVTHRFGRAVDLRRLSRSHYDKLRNDLGHKGPYLPVLLEACAEQELAGEYRHGAVSYGAFTYSLSEALRANRSRLKSLSFTQLSDLVMKRLSLLKYNQHPCLVGPKQTLAAKIPWVQPPDRRKKASLNTSV